MGSAPSTGAIATMGFGRAAECDALIICIAHAAQAGPRSGPEDVLATVEAILRPAEVFIEPAANLVKA